MQRPTREKKGKTILVAGGAGFVGSHLCDALLARGDRVICMDNYLTGSVMNIRPLTNNPSFRMIEMDICDAKDIDEPVDQIYNLACAASPPQYQADPVHTMMTCVSGTGNLLKIAERHGASFLMASTSEVYGDPEQHPQREDYRGNVSCTGPRACYDEGKRAAEALCFDMYRAGKVDARVVRIFNTYGPRMQPNDGRVVSSFIVQALKGEPITVFGDGGQTRSFCYVDDLVEAIMRLMVTAEDITGPINLGNNSEFTIRELAEKVIKLTGSRSKLVFKPLPQDDPRQRQPDLAKAKTMLNWEPKVALEDGLKETIAYFKHSLDIA